VRLVTPPGVFRPISDTWLLADALDREPLPPGARVLDLCSGSGALAIRAALRGRGKGGDDRRREVAAGDGPRLEVAAGDGPRRDVTAVDVSRRAVATIRLNALLNGVHVRARRGDLLDAVAGERYDAIVSNPPYVPAPTDELPARGLARAWDAGRDGRALLDRICQEAPDHLRPGGVILLVHSSLLGFEPTAEALAHGGLDVDIVARERGPLGPLMNGRRAHLEAVGLLEPGCTEEDVLVVRGRKPATTHCRSAPLNVTM
jgi:release factor glutamine methyltransferase